MGHNIHCVGEGGGRGWEEVVGGWGKVGGWEKGVRG